MYIFLVIKSKTNINNWNYHVFPIILHLIIGKEWFILGPILCPDSVSGQGAIAVAAASWLCDCKAVFYCIHGRSPHRQSPLPAPPPTTAGPVQWTREKKKDWERSGIIIMHARWWIYGEQKEDEESIKLGSHSRRTSSSIMIINDSRRRHHRHHQHHRQDDATDGTNNLQIKFSSYHSYTNTTTTSFSLAINSMLTRHCRLQTFSSPSFAIFLFLLHCCRRHRFVGHIITVIIEPFVKQHAS